MVTISATARASTIAGVPYFCQAAFRIRDSINIAVSLTADLREALVITCIFSFSSVINAGNAPFAAY